MFQINILLFIFDYIYKELEEVEENEEEEIKRLIKSYLT